MLEIVIDTNVFYSGLRSPHGASYRVLRLIGQGRFNIHISVPLVLEYESIAKRHLDTLPIGSDGVDDVVDYICRVAIPHEIHYQWRPVLTDPGDEMLLELASAARCDAIVTFNKRDFRGSDRFGMRLLTPGELLQELGELP